MTLKQYHQILNTTINSVAFYDIQQKPLLENLKYVIDVSYKMKYAEVLKIVKKLLDKYGYVSTGMLEEDKYVTYIVIKAPLKVKESIQNLRFNIENKQASDVSEKILNIK